MSKAEVVAHVRVKVEVMEPVFDVSRHEQFVLLQIQSEARQILHLHDAFRPMLAPLSEVGDESPSFVSLPNHENLTHRFPTAHDVFHFLSAHFLVYLLFATLTQSFLSRRPNLPPIGGFPQN